MSEFSVTSGSPPVYQRTIKRRVEYRGVGLHSGRETHLAFLPAPPDAGIIFRRTDIAGAPEIPAQVEYFIETPIMCSTVGIGNVEVRLIEHIMATLCAFGIDNLLIEIDNDEPPFEDGSALPFVSLLREAGCESQDTLRRPLRLNEPLVYKEGEVEMTAFPAANFRVTFFVSYPHPMIGNQAYSMDVTPESFVREIASARTFCFEQDVQNMMVSGLLKGASENSSLVFGDRGLLLGKLQCPDEPVRHKVMDLIGDLYLLGAPLMAHVTANRSGHNAHARFMKLIGKELEKGNIV